MNLGYLDDVTLGGLASTVASDVEEIVNVGTEMGLTLNTSKCELIAHRDSSVEDDLLQSFARVDISAATVLGAPLFAGPALDEAWSERCDDLARAVDRLTLVSSQDALILAHRMH